MTERGHPLDTCECGDYRRDHKGGTGICVFTAEYPGDGHFGAGRCERFKLHRLHSNNGEDQKR